MSGVTSNPSNRHLQKRITATLITEGIRKGILDDGVENILAVVPESEESDTDAV